MTKPMLGIRMHDLGQSKPGPLAEKLAGYGLACGQLAIQKSIPGIRDYHDVDDALLGEIKSAFAQNGIYTAVLGCYIEPVHPDLDERRRQLDNFAGGIHSAAFLQAGCIGTETPAPGRDHTAPEAFDDLCRSVEFMLEKAEPAGVLVALEPVRTHVMRTPELAHRILNMFKGAKLGIIFDALNVLEPGQVDTQEALWGEYMDAVGDSVVACHIKDAVPSADGSDWQECVLGRGVLRYEGICARLAGRAQMPLLREGFVAEHAEEEITFLKGLAAAIGE